MAEYIKCRNCESPDCKGCNLKRLETMLNNGKFDCLMNENRCVNQSADVAPVRHGWWVKRGCEWQCTQCKVLMSIDGTPKENLLNYCPNCGADMKGSNDE